MATRKQVQENKPGKSPKVGLQAPDTAKRIEEAPANVTLSPRTVAAPSAPQSPLDPRYLLSLQRKVGNATVTRLLDRRQELQASGTSQIQRRETDLKAKSVAERRTQESPGRVRGEQAHAGETLRKAEASAIQRQHGEAKPAWLRPKTAPKPKVDTAKKFKRYVATNRSNYLWVAAMDYAGVFPGDAAAKDGKLYFDPNYSQNGGETSDRRKRQWFKKNFLVGYKFYKIFTRVGPHTSEEELTATLRHEYEHTLHARTARKHRKVFAAKNKAQYEIVTSWKWWKRDEARKKLTGKGAMEVAVGGKLKKVFGADVSQKANTEVLAHTAAFGAMFKAAPEASAQQLVPLVVISLLKLAFTYDQASSDAKRQAIQQVVDPLKKWSDFWVFMKKVWPVLLKAERSVTKTTKFLDDLKKDAAFAGNIKRWNNRKKRRRVKRRHR